MELCTFMSVGVALTLASLIYSTGGQFDTSNYISWELEIKLMSLFWQEHWSKSRGLSRCDTLTTLSHANNMNKNLSKAKVSNLCNR